MNGTDILPGSGRRGEEYVVPAIGESGVYPAASESAAVNGTYILPGSGGRGWECSPALGGSGAYPAATESAAVNGKDILK